MSRKIIIIAFLSCLIFLALAFGLAANYIANGHLAELLSQQLGSEITVQEIEPTLSRGVRLRGITVKEGERVILKAKEVALRVDFLLALKKPSSWMQALTGADIIEPELWLERKADGRWNVAELLNRKSGKGEFPQDLQPKIFLSKGKLNLVDRQKKIKSLTLTDISGQAVLKENPEIAFALSGQENKMTFAFKGKVNLHDKKITGQAEVKQLELALWRDYLPLEEKVQLKRGLVRAKLNLTGYYPKAITYSGKVFLTDGEVYLPELQASCQKIQAKARVSKEKLELNRLAFNLGQNKIQTKGEIYLANEVQADLYLELKKIVWRDLLNLAPLQKYRSLPLPSQAKGKIHLLYSEEKIILPDIALRLYRGKLTGRGSYDLKERDFRAELQAEGLDIKELALPVERGRVNFTLSLKGKDKELLYAEAKVLGQRLSWEGVPFSYVSGRLFWDKGILGVNDLLLDSPYLKGRVSGRKDDAWQVNVNYLDLDFWTKKYKSKIPVFGTASFLGTVKQKGKKVEVQGDLFADRGKVMGQEFKLISGRFVLADKQLSLDSVSLKNDLTAYLLNGRLALNASAEADLNLKLSNVALQPWLKYFSCDKLPLTGEVFGEISLKGSLHDPDIAGELNLRSASYGSEELDQGILRFSYQDKTLTLDRLEICQEDTRLLLTGKLPNGKEGEFVLSCTALDLGMVPYLSDKLLPGSRKGNLYGRIKVNNAGHGLILQDMILEHGENRYSASGGIMLDRKNPAFNLLVKIENSSVDLLSSLMPSSLPNNFTGRIAGQAKLWGSLKAPCVKGDLAILDGRIGDYPLGQADTSFVWQDETLKIVKLVIPVDEGLILLKGSVQPDKLIDLEIAGKKVKADVVRELYSLPEEAGGDFSFNIQVSGQTKNPKADGYIEISNGRVREIGFDRLTALLSLSDKMVKVQSVLLEKDQYKMHGSGVLALDEKGPVDLTLRMKEGDLGLLALFGSKQIEAASGAASVWINISGTRLKPYVKGEVTVSEGMIKPKFFKEPLTDFNAQLIIEQNTVLVNYLNGRLGGGTIAASGKAEKLFTPEASLDFALNTASLYPKTPVFSGKISSELHLTGLLKAPVLRGDIFLEKGKAHIPAVFATGEGFKCPLKLDLNLVLKDDLEVEHILFLMKLRGELKAEGTAEKPEISGSLGVKKGTINYLGTKFNVLKGDIVFKPSLGLLPEVKIGSKTRVGQNTVYLLAKGPVSDLEVEFFSDPPMSKNEIITLLTLGQKLGEGETELNINSSLFRLVGQSLSVGFLQGMEEEISNTLGLDEFHLNSNLSGSPQLVLGKSFIDQKLYVTYTLNTRLIEVDNDSQKEQEEWFLEARYKLPRNMNLTYTCNDLGESKVMLLKTFRF